MQGDFYKWRDVSPSLYRFLLWQDEKTLREVEQIFSRIKGYVDSGLDGLQHEVDVARNFLRRPGFSYQAAESFFRDEILKIPEKERPKYEGEVQRVLREAYYGNEGYENGKVLPVDLIDAEELELIEAER